MWNRRSRLVKLLLLSMRTRMPSSAKCTQFVAQAGFRCVGLVGQSRNRCCSSRP